MTTPTKLRQAPTCAGSPSSSFLGLRSDPKPIGTSDEPSLDQQDQCLRPLCLDADDRRLSLGGQITWQGWQFAVPPSSQQHPGGRAYGVSCSRLLWHGWLCGEAAKPDCGIACLGRFQGKGKKHCQLFWIVLLRPKLLLFLAASFKWPGYLCTDFISWTTHCACLRT